MGQNRSCGRRVLVLELKRCVRMADGLNMIELSELALPWATVRRFTARGPDRLIFLRPYGTASRRNHRVHAHDTCGLCNMPVGTGIGR